METATMETAAIVSSTIAVTSLLVNVYQAYLIRNYRTNLARDDDVRTRLYNLKHKLDETSLVSVPPHYEVWEYGFKSLEELREVAVKCNGLLQVAPDGRVPRELKNAVRQLVEDIKGLYQYRDSYTRFSRGKLITSQEKIEAWPDFERAKHALSVLQAAYRSNLPTIDAHLTRMY
jgi:hypothetical protein